MTETSHTGTWKEIVIKFSSFGAGFAFMLALIIGLIIWVGSRPKSPQPWNATGITATFDYADTEGPENTIVVFYTLENNTPHDYIMDDDSNAIILVKLEKQKSLSGKKDDEALRIDKHLFIPSKHRLSLAVHLNYPFDKKKLGDKSTLDERHDYRKSVGEYIDKELSNLGGFVLFDVKNRYEINLPKGW